MARALCYTLQVLSLQCYRLECNSTVMTSTHTTAMAYINATRPHLARRSSTLKIRYIRNNTMYTVKTAFNANTVIDMPVSP
jgi:hypothetical protein